MSSSKFLTLFLVIATVGMLLTLEGCGGGSAGTGFDPQGRNVTIEGALLTSQNEPLAGVIVTVVETGSSTVSDSSGLFSLNTPPTTGDAELTFERGEVTGETTVALSQDSSSVQIVVVLTPELTTVTSSSYTMTSGINGACAEFFSDETPIRQLSPVPAGTECSAMVQILAGQDMAQKVPFAVQYRSCEDDAPWITIALGQTSEGEAAGSGNITFPYVDDTRRCVYRIVAPFNIDGATLVAKEIQTQTFLARTEVRATPSSLSGNQFVSAFKLVDF